MTFVFAARTNQFELWSPEGLLQHRRRLRGKLEKEGIFQERRNSRGVNVIWSRTRLQNDRPADGIQVKPPRGRRFR